MRSHSNIVISLLVALSLILTGGTSRATEPTSKEYQLKAAFIYNFAKFVEWPAQKFVHTDSPIVIGVYGSNPFGNELLNTVKGRKINGRAIQIIAVNSATTARETHLLFVSAGSVGSFGAISGSLGQGVLVVGETPQLTNQGGMIIFNLVGDKLRFEINMTKANRSGLKISSQLQKLASAIHR